MLLFLASVTVSYNPISVSTSSMSILLVISMDTSPAQVEYLAGVVALDSVIAHKTNLCRKFSSTKTVN